MDAPHRLPVNGTPQWSHKRAYFVEYLMNKYTTMTPKGIEEASVREFGLALGYNAIECKLGELVKSGRAEKLARGVYRWQVR